MRFLRNPVATKHARFQSEHDFSAHLLRGRKRAPRERGGSAELTFLVADARISGMNSPYNGAPVCLCSLHILRGERATVASGVIRQLPAYDHRTEENDGERLYGARLSGELGRVGT